MFNFSIGDILVVKQTYVQNTLAKSDPSLPQGSRALNIRNAVETLSSLGDAAVTYTSTGTVENLLPNGTVNRVFVNVVPVDTTHSSYRNGRGVSVFWEDYDTLNDVFELSKNRVTKSECGVRVINGTGSTIAKGRVVRLLGYDTTQQLNTVALADATTTENSAVYGLTEEAIAAGAAGTVLTKGTFQGLDTNMFNTNDLVFLSDTPGMIATDAGTIPIIVGRVTCVASPPDGVIIVVGLLPLQLGGPDGPQGETGIRGDTGLDMMGVTGLMGTPGQTGILGDTGVRGITGIAAGETGIRGIPGATGVQGIQGNTGVGPDGATGVSTGPDGATGIQGIVGPTGPNGSTGPTGPQGATGLEGLGLNAFNTSIVSTPSINATFGPGSTTMNTGISNPRMWFFYHIGMNHTAGGGTAFDAIWTTGGSINTSTGQITVTYSTNPFGVTNEGTTAWYGGACR